MKRQKFNRKEKNRFIAVYVLIGILITLLTATLYKGVRVDKTFEKPSIQNQNVLEASSPQQIVVNHTSVELFDQIPQQYIEAARNIKMVFSDRSVGVNINESLDCLAANSWARSSASCRRDYYPSDWKWKTYNQTDLDNGIIPSRIQFAPDPIKYERSNWAYVITDPSNWHQMLDRYVNYLVPTYLSQNDIVTFQFNYLSVSNTSKIMSEPSVNPSPTQPESYGGFFYRVPEIEGRYDVSDLEAIEAENPNKTFIYWTTSLSRPTGNKTATDFNNAMREYTRTNNKILFDVADIESHTETGAPCYDSRDGIQYCNSTTGACENYPDDGVQYPAICQDYTTEVDGGHLGSVSGARIRLAKAYWVLMAEVAGWNPSVVSGPIPTTVESGGGTEILTPTRRISATPTPTEASSTTTPTPTSSGNSLNTVHIGDIDGSAKLVTGGWQARYIIYVHDSSHKSLPGATVSGTLYSGWTGTRTCTTNNSGWCALTSDRINSSATVGMVINSISLSGYSYNSSTNHDPDGDSDGTSSQVSN